MGHKGGFTASEICSIIRACKDSRITSVKYNGLAIEMDVQEKVEIVHENVSRPLAKTPLWDDLSKKPEPVFSQKGPVPQGDYEPQLTPDQENLMAELELEQLQMEDPLAYETHIIDSHIKGIANA